MNVIDIANPARIDAALAAVAGACRANTAIYHQAAAANQRITLPSRSAGHVKRYEAGDVEPLTWFHSRGVPAFSLSQLFVSMSLRDWCFDVPSAGQTLALMLRYSERTGVAVTAGMMHRLFLAAMLVVSKAHHDVFPRNDAFAQATGMTLWEVNRLEAALVEGCGWDVQVSAEQVEAILRLTAPPDVPQPNTTADAADVAPVVAGDRASRGKAPARRVGDDNRREGDDDGPPTSPFGIEAVHEQPWN